MNAAGVRVCELCRVGSEVAWFCLECEAAFLKVRASVFFLSPRYCFIPRASVQTMKTQIFISRLSKFSSDFKSQLKIDEFFDWHPTYIDSVCVDCVCVGETDKKWFLNIKEAPQVALIFSPRPFSFLLSPCIMTWLVLRSFDHTRARFISWRR